MVPLATCGGASYSDRQQEPSLDQQSIDPLPKAPGENFKCTIMHSLLFGLLLPVVIGTPSALYQSIVPFIKKASVAPKEITIGFSPKGWRCCRVKSLFLLHGIYHPGMDRLLKLGLKVWNASLSKCLLEAGGAMGGGELLLL